MGFVFSKKLFIVRDCGEFVDFGLGTQPENITVVLIKTVARGDYDISNTNN